MVVVLAMALVLVDSTTMAMVEDSDTEVVVLAATIAIADHHGVTLTDLQQLLLEFQIRMFTMAPEGEEQETHQVLLRQEQAVVMILLEM